MVFALIWHACAFEIEWNAMRTCLLMKLADKDSAFENIGFKYYHTTILSFFKSCYQLVMNYVRDNTSRYLTTSSKQLCVAMNRKDSLKINTYWKRLFRNWNKNVLNVICCDKNLSDV